MLSNSDLFSDLPSAKSGHVQQVLAFSHVLEVIFLLDIRRPQESPRHFWTTRCACQSRTTQGCFAALDPSCNMVILLDYFEGQMVHFYRHYQICRRWTRCHRTTWKGDVGQRRQCCSSLLQRRIDAQLGVADVSMCHHILIYIKNYI